MVHFERGDETERLVRDTVVGEANPLSKVRPAEIVRGGQKTHGAIPESPP